MADTFEIEIATPEKLVVRQRAETAQIPGKDGYMGILPGHAALLAADAAEAEQPAAQSGPGAPPRRLSARRAVKLRILASIVGVAAIAVLLVGVPLALAVDHLYSSEEVLRLEREASETRRAIDVSTLGRGDPIELPKTGATSFAVYDPAGRRIAGSGPAVADDPVRRALLGDVRDARASGTIVVAVPINGNERIAGVLRASKSSKFVVDRTRRTWLVMGIIGAAALTIAGLLALFLARRLTQPVDALVSAAERLGGCFR